jgi:tripartite ATP-independent transporter DctM subunit
MELIFGVMIATMFICILIRIPIAFCMGIATLVAGLASERVPFVIIPQRMFTGIDSFPPMAIPFFILAGVVMNESGITDRLFRFSLSLVGHLKGGLAHVSVVASMIFAGMSGSALAEAGGLGLVEIKAMREKGYDPPFAAAISAAAATIGPIIPPSIPMVVYAALAGVSTGRMFIGGIIPGILMGLSLMVMVHFYAKKRNFPVEGRPTFGKFAAALRGAGWALLTPVIILGGIGAGVCTPTEAAAVAAMYSLIVAFCIYKTIRMADMPRILSETVRTTSIVMFIIAVANAFGWVVTLMQAPSLLLKIIQGWNIIIILLVVNVVFLIAGCLMESLAILVIATPIFLPVMMKLGIDPVHFGVFMILNLMIGLLTPPVGLAVYVVSRIAEEPTSTVFRATAPFLIPLTIVLLIITFYPPAVLFLPTLVYGR